MNNTTRREALRHIAWFSVAMSLDHAYAQTDSANAWIADPTSNFKAIYQNPALKSAFLLFLKNVYNLYPEDQFHQLIDRATRSGKTDKEIYLLIQSQLSTITPFLSELRYSLPALRKQKDEMTRQTLEVLGSVKAVKGYMEIGTTGRYLSRLKSSIKITGDVVLLHSEGPSYSMADIMERGQPAKLGRFVPLKDYQPIASHEVPDNSLDLVSNYIGIHHSPPAKRDGFVRSIYRVLRPGGRMVLRDHDVTSIELNHMVALAHDVFNAGLGTGWSVNQQEIRNFTSTAELVRYLDRFGFKPNPQKKPLLQAGDPTQNALIEFVKV
jgi:SAM-dependent methyltransferase